MITKQYTRSSKMITWTRYGGNKVPVATVDDATTPEAHKINCEEFAIVSYVQNGSTYGNYKNDPIAKQAMDNTYDAEIEPDLYGAVFISEYKALKNNTTTVEQEEDDLEEDLEEDVDFTEEDESNED
tara:strand:- start:76 stop:456 length:381 start_codon:yes stop_codon:yes gene_type:complete